jgi:transposase
MYGYPLRAVEPLRAELRWRVGGAHECRRAAAGAPPYSPELNPAERVFEEVRRWTEGKVYGSLEAKQAFHLGTRPTTR